MKNNLQAKSGSAFLVIIIVIATVALVGLVAYGIFSTDQFKKTPEVTQVVDSQIQDLESISESDEIGDIEKDISATDLENLDQELSDVDRELKSL